MPNHSATRSACSRSAYSGCSTFCRWKSTIQTDRTKRLCDCYRSAGNRAMARDRQTPGRPARMPPKERIALERSTAMSGISSRSRPWVIPSFAERTTTVAARSANGWPIDPAYAAVAPLAKNTAPKLARSSSRCCRNPPDVRSGLPSQYRADRPTSRLACPHLERTSVVCRPTG